MQLGGRRVEAGKAVILVAAERLTAAGTFLTAAAAVVRHGQPACVDGRLVKVMEVQ